MDPEISASPIAYPDEATLSRGVSFSALSLEGTQDMNNLWLTVKTEDNTTLRYLILTGAAIVLVILLWLFFKVRKRRQKARRCRKWKQTPPA